LSVFFWFVEFANHQPNIEIIEGPKNRPKFKKMIQEAVLNEMKMIKKVKKMNV
jgi:hypothetical protein